MVVAKLKKIVEHSKLVIFTQCGSSLSSPIVALQKPNGDFRICGNYKVGVNNQICSDSFSLHTTETANHEFAGTKYFAKIDMKSLYNQTEIC